MVAAAGVAAAAIPSTAPPGNSAAAMIAQRGDTPTTRGGAIILAGVVTSATVSDSGMTTLPSAMASDSGMMTTLTVVTIAGSVALSVMASPIMMTMVTTGTMAGDAVGCTAEQRLPIAPIGGIGITPASTTPTDGGASGTTARGPVVAAIGVG